MNSGLTATFFNHVGRAERTDRPQLRLRADEVADALDLDDTLLDSLLADLGLE